MIDPNSTEMKELFKRFVNDMNQPQQNLSLAEKLEQVLDNGWHCRNWKNDTTLKRAVHTINNPHMVERATIERFGNRTEEDVWAWIFVYEKSWRPDTNCPKLPTVK